jgi:hypothetical protein
MKRIAMISARIGSLYIADSFDHENGIFWLSFVRVDRNLPEKEDVEYLRNKFENNIPDFSEIKDFEVYPRAKLEHIEKNPNWAKSVVVEIAVDSRNKLEEFLHQISER